MQHFCSIWAIFYDPWALCPLFIYYWALWGQNFWAKFFYKVALFAKLWALFHWLRLVTLQTKTNGLSASNQVSFFYNFPFLAVQEFKMIGQVVIVVLAMFAAG